MVRNNHLSFFQELIGNANALVQEPTRIATEIEDQAFHFSELLKGVFNFTFCGFIERGDVHVAHARSNFKFQVNAVARNLVTDHSELKGFFRALTQDADVNRSALGAFQHVRHITGGQVVSGLAVNSDDYVARANAGLIGGSSHERGQDNHLVIARSNGHTDAVVFSALLFTQGRIRLGIKEIGVRIQDMKHAWNRAVIDGFIGVHRFGIILLDEVVNLRELLKVVPDIGIGCRGLVSLAEADAQKTTNKDDQEDDE